MRTNINHLAQVMETHRKGPGAEIQERWAYYLGDHPKSLKIRVRNADDDNTVINTVKTIADIHAHGLVGGGLAITGIEGGDSPSWLLDDVAEFAKELSQQLYAPTLAITGGVAASAITLFGAPRGDSFFPSVHVLDPASTVIQYKDGSPYRLIHQGIIEDPDDGTEYDTIKVIEPSDSGTWVTYDWRRQRSILYHGLPWQQTGEEEWPFEWRPWIGTPNTINPKSSAPHIGQPDVTAAEIRGNHAINRALSMLMRGISTYGDPLLVGKGTASKEIDPETGREVISSVDIEPGVIVDIPSDGDIYAIDVHSDIAGGLAFVDKLKAAVFTSSSTPRVAAGDIENISDYSGVALRILFLPMLMKLASKHETYGPHITEVVRRAVEYRRGEEVYADEVSVVFPDPIPKNALEDAQAVRAELDAGRSKHSAFRERGWDYETELDYLRDEGTDASISQEQGRAGL